MLKLSFTSKMKIMGYHKIHIFEIKKRMKNNLTKMMGLDIYLSSYPEQKNKKVNLTIENSASQFMPLLSWDLYSTFYTNMSVLLKKDNDIQELEKLADKFKWKIDINSILKEESFDALVITDHQKKIMWVNEGFTHMTGYPKTFAIDKTPSFLQGKKTSVQVKDRIRRKIAKDIPFTDIIINYRKDKTPYKCQIKIIPIRSKDATYYLAIEKEVA
tara:strand:- start:11138 stop:11782 length:645 start_codon:yes stop_codon:yes gene_type:complete